MVDAERAKFLSTVQNQREADDDFLLTFCEAAWFCKLSELKNTPDAIDELIRMKFISGQISMESKITLIEANRSNTDIVFIVLRSSTKFYWDL